MIFDGFLTRLGTVMALGARHGRKGFPTEEQGIAIPVWGMPEPSEINTKPEALTEADLQDAKVTPLRPKDQAKEKGGANG